MLEAAVLVLAGAAGLTGAWSPCGFSMVETVRGPLSRLAFAAGALAGGALTFGALSLLGEALGAGGAGALAAASLVAVAAAAGEARGARIVPQIRRQVPESWRRLAPLTLASAGYGVLLGLGFTTFVLSFAVWALAALCVAVGSPLLGLGVGAAFGLGRALPVLVLRAGGRVHAAMAERPSIYRALRLGDAAALLVAAAALAAEPARAADVHVASGTDPAVSGEVFAWHVPGRSGFVNRAGRTDQLPGSHPALGGGLVGWREGSQVVLAEPHSFTPVVRVDAPGSGPFAVSERWLVWIAPLPEGGDVMLVKSLEDVAAAPRVLYTVRHPATLGRPSVEGDRAVFHVAGRRGTRLVDADLPSGALRRLREEPRAQLLNPSLRGGRLLYVRATYTRQQLKLGSRVIYSTVPTGRRDNAVEPGGRKHNRRRLPERPAPGVQVTLWTTALGDRSAYVTRLVKRKGRRLRSTVLRVDLPG